MAGLMRDAAAYFRAAPWRLIDDDQILAARLAAAGARQVVTRYVSVLGGAGQTFGLSVLRSLAGVRAVLAEGPEAAGRVAAVAVTYDRLEEAQAATRERLRQRYEIAGERAFPLFMRMPVDQQVRQPKRAELDELRALLQALAAWAQGPAGMAGPWPYHARAAVRAIGWEVALSPLERR